MSLITAQDLSKSYGAQDVLTYISFAIPNFHKASMEYTPLQEEVLSALEKSGLKEGMYMLGQADPELSKEDYKSATENYQGKPWATLNYQEDSSMSMPLNMVRGFIIAFVIALIFFWVLRQQKDPSLLKSVFLGVGIGTSRPFKWQD